MLDQITPEILVDAVDEMLVVQRGKELGYTLGDAQFKSVLENIRTQNKLENEEQFQAALKQEGLTMADLRKNLERQMIWQRVQQNEVVNKVAMTEEEARAYYDSHLHGIHDAGRRSRCARSSSARRPMPKGVNVAADEAARARADAIRARALAGESFEKLAADVSDSASRANGGLIGPIKLDDLSADLRKIIEAMKIGEVSEPLRTTRGYQILKLESSSPTQTLAFEQAREQIADRVLGRQAEARIREVPREAARAGHHRVEEPGHQEGLRRGPEAAGRCRRRPRRRRTDDGRHSDSGRSGSPSGPARATNRSSANSSNERRSSRFCRPSRAGAGGRIARRRSTGRCFPATASRNSIPTTRCRS